MEPGDKLFEDFFELAKIGGKLEAIKDIFDILNNELLTQEQTVQALALYQNNTVQELTKVTVIVNEKSKEDHHEV